MTRKRAIEASVTVEQAREKVMESIDKRFVLHASNGDRLYPYKKSQKSTGRFGFALSRPGEQDRHGQGTYTSNIEEVIKRLVFDGWNVRAKTAKGSGSSPREGTFGINKQAVRGYEVSKEFEHLITAAPSKPLNIFSPQAKDVDPITKNARSFEVGERPVDEAVLRQIKSRRGQPKFRRKLLVAFDNKCCVSGYAVESVLEAAHIVPHTEETNYSVENGVLLRADIHTLYDLNIIGIDGEGRIIVSEFLKESEYWRFHGKCISGRITEAMSSNLNRRHQLYNHRN
jgi:hypothetical protein